MALENVNEDCLWLNGDVIFDHDVVSRVKNNEGNIIAVNTSKCQEEKIKYTTDSTGFINPFQNLFKMQAGKLWDQHL